MYLIQIFSSCSPYSLFPLVAAIIGHLSFFIHQESSNETNSLERAAKIYQQSTCDTSVKQAIEKLFQLENLSKDFRATQSKHAIFNHFKGSHVDHALLVEVAIQTAMNNLLCKDFVIQILFVNEY